MNVISQDKFIASSSHPPWLPLVTQQLRLRHLNQVLGYNLENNENKGFHFSLHLTSMSAPFYTSDISYGENPKWSELKLEDMSTLRISCFVIRIWQEKVIRLTWGINLTGLIYLGTKLGDLRPEHFDKNTVIFSMRGGYFTSKAQPRTDLSVALPFIEHMNVLSTSNELKVFKLISIKQSQNDIKRMYDVKKLQRLQYLQLNIKKRHLAACDLRNKLVSKLNPPVNAKEEEGEHVKSESSDNKHIRYAPQLLTMNSLHKMLQNKPTNVQKSEMITIQKNIETIKLKNKILLQERERMTNELQLLKDKLNTLCDDNEEKNSLLMENYMKISKDLEAFRQWKKSFIRDRENLYNLTKKLQHKRRQLMVELLLLYPIRNINSKYYINGVELPNSDLLLDHSEASLSIALGYCSHILVMCASFLQIPLRYPIRHFGSRSVIEDPLKPEKYKEFPLFTRGKDPKHFNHAVFLLNKNIAQYLHDLGFRRQDLKATLPNLLTLLQGKEHKYSIDTQYNEASQSVYGNDSDLSESSAEQTVSVVPPKPSFKMRSATTSCTDPILDNIREEVLKQSYLQQKKTHSKIAKNSEFSQIMVIPEAILNKQISESTFLSYMKTDNLDKSPFPSPSTSALFDDLTGNVASANSSKFQTVHSDFNNVDNIATVASTSKKLEPDELIHANGSGVRKNLTEQDKCAKLQQSDENLSDIKHKSLNVRTDALVQRTCFKLVKPRCSSE